MIAAFACWQDRIAPVFDTAQQAHLVEVSAGRIEAERRAPLVADLPVRKVLQLVELNVDTLVCGAISRALQEQIAAHGITVIPFVAGELGEIVQAWLDGSLQRGAFDMPGCCGRRRRRRGQRRNERTVRPCRAEIAKDPWDKDQ